MILPDKEQFEYKECTIGGDLCWLIQPNHMGVKWTDENARFRSVIVRQSDNHVISQGFRKFVNFHETPSFEPWDNAWPVEARHKIDGSLLIVSKYKGELIIRTRGTTDARKMPNGHEIDLLIEKYPDAFDNGWLNREMHSFLFEWTTPTNIIVIREDTKPTLRLIGIVDHETARYENQTTLDIVGEKLHVLRPIPYDFKNIIECRSEVMPWKGKEGVVVYSPCGQILKKFKSTEYKDLHRLAAGLSTIGGILETYMNGPEYFTSIEDFSDYVEKVADFEIAERNMPFIIDVIEAYCKVQHDMSVGSMFINTMLADNTTMAVAEQAKYIINSLSQYPRAFAFNYLHDRPIEKQLIKNAMKHHLGIR
jgi:hypothetical protein